MPNITLKASTLQFLKQLSLHNNREWFQANKDAYLLANQNMVDFVDALLQQMNKHDVIENESGKKSLYRIYSDVRFKKDKAPYNARFAFSFSRATKLRRGSYYMCIKPGSSYLACGFFGPNPADLKLIRDHIAADPESLENILKTKNIVKNFGGLSGDQVATVPRGFDAGQEGITLIRHKQFILRCPLSDAEVLSKDFVIRANALFKSQRPFLDYMSEILTTNLNGEMLVG